MCDPKQIEEYQKARDEQKAATVELLSVIREKLGALALAPVTPLFEQPVKARVQSKSNGSS